MQLLVIGSGGREHALAWKLAQSPRVHQVWIAPGNPGMANDANLTPVAIGVDDFAGLAQFAKQNHIQFTLVGPENPLASGIVDYFEAQDLPCFGPGQQAAQLEASKAFAKAFMHRHRIPTASYQVFDQMQPALDYLTQCDFPQVIKADGLAAGKGVVIADDLATAQRTVQDMMKAQQFGKAGQRVVIEQFLQGEEASFMVMVDGDTALPLASSQDHKARDDGDRGPNTGGMGAYSPAPVIDDQLTVKILEEVIYPTLAGLQQEGITYRGFLYAGLMIDCHGEINVLEYNCRLGDPETQPIMMRLQSDFADLCQAALQGQLSRCELEWDSCSALGVVMAAEGYPSTVTTGDAIQQLPQQKNTRTKVFYAGVSGSQPLTTAGGRVLCVTALGEDLAEAADLAYQQVDTIQWRGAFYRRDIGHRGLASDSGDRN